MNAIEKAAATPELRDLYLVADAAARMLDRWPMLQCLHEGQELARMLVRAGAVQIPCDPQPGADR